MVSVKKIATIALIWIIPTVLFTIWFRWWLAQLDDEFAGMPAVEQAAPSTAINSDLWAGLKEYQPADREILSDFSCKETELHKHACQIKCRDNLCSSAWKLCEKNPECDGITFNKAESQAVENLHGKMGRWATLKQDSTVSRAGREFYFRFHSSEFGLKGQTKDDFQPGPHNGNFVDDDDNQEEQLLIETRRKGVPMVAGNGPDFLCSETMKGSKTACQIKCRGNGCANGYYVCEQYKECNGISFNTGSPESIAADGLWATLKRGGEQVSLDNEAIGRPDKKVVGVHHKNECERVCSSRSEGFTAGPFCLKMEGMGGKVFICF
jgi:hypothetical protein